MGVADVAVFLALGGISLYFIAMVLWISASLPLSSTSWISGRTSYALQSCSKQQQFYSNTDCTSGGLVYFQVFVTPYWASLVYNSQTTYILGVPWNMMNSVNLCDLDSDIYDRYSGPTGLCTELGYVGSSALTTTQIMIPLAICMSFLTMGIFLCTACMNSSTRILFMYFLVVVSTITTFAFGITTVTSWNSFSVTSQYYANKLNTVPIWNATIIHQGQILVKTKYESHYEQSYAAVGINYNQLIPTSEFTSASTSNGYNLWIAGLVFIGIAQTFVLCACIPVIRVYQDAKRADSGSFGTGINGQLPYVPPVATEEVPVKPNRPPPQFDESLEALKQS